MHPRTTSVRRNHWKLYELRRAIAILLINDKLARWQARWSPLPKPTMLRALASKIEAGELTAPPQTASSLIEQEE